MGRSTKTSLSLNLYDYGARNYDPAIGRWMNIDPLVEKFFSFTPYNYVMNSPIGKFDPDGMDVYFVNAQGQFTLALKQAGKDILYSTTEDEFGFTQINDWDGSSDEGTAFGGGIELTHGILSQLTSYKTDNSGYAYYLTSVDSNPSTEADMLKLFHFVANNTNVEFSMDFYSDNKNQKKIVLGTYQLDTHSPGYDTYGIQNNSQIIKSYHNHPRNTNYRESILKGNQWEI